MSDPNFFLSRLNGEPHALAFGGQSTPWPVALADLTNDPALEATLRLYLDGTAYERIPLSLIHI